MPLVEIHMAAGRTKDQKRRLLAAVTEAIVEELEVPVTSVRVWISEFEPDELMAGGILLAERERAGDG